MSKEVLLMLRTNDKKGQCCADERGEQAARVDCGKAPRCGQMGSFMDREMAGMAHTSRSKEESDEK